MSQGMNSSGSNGSRTKNFPLNAIYAAAYGGGLSPTLLKAKFKIINIKNL